MLNQKGFRNIDNVKIVLILMNYIYVSFFSIRVQNSHLKLSTVFFCTAAAKFLRWLQLSLHLLEQQQLTRQFRKHFLQIFAETSSYSIVNKKSNRCFNFTQGRMCFNQLFCIVRYNCFFILPDWFMQWIRFLSQVNIDFRCS